MGRIMVFRELEDCYAFFSHDASCTDIYTLSLHDALPIWKTGEQRRLRDGQRREVRFPEVRLRRGLDAIGLVAVVDLVEVELEDLLLRVRPRDLDGEDRLLDLARDAHQIGRASCRERV